MIEQLAIHRFRGVRRGKLEDFGKFNVLIGPNNSGKTSVLEMLYLTGASGRDCALRSETLYEKVQQMVEKKMEGSQNKLDAIDETISGFAPLAVDFTGRAPWSRIWQRHGQSSRWEAGPADVTLENSLDVHLKFLKGNHVLRMFRLIPPPSDDIKNYGGFNQLDAQTVASFALPAKDILPPDLLPACLHPHLAEANLADTWFTFAWHPSFINEMAQADPKEEDFPLAAWAVRQRDRVHPNHVLLFDFHAMNGPFTPAFRNMAWKTVPDWYEKIADALGRVYPELASCRVEIAANETLDNSYTGYIRLPGAKPLAVDHFGDGARHAFKMLASLIALKELASEERPGLFLWEDPELFMHPSALRSLLQEVTTVIRDCPIQMFLCSQSKEVLDIIVDLAGKGILPSRELQSFQLQLREGRLLVQPITGETLGVWMEYKDPRVPEEGLEVAPSSEQEEA
jgi:hypothetical protein